MTHKIQISEIHLPEEGRNYRNETVFEQTVEDLDLPAVIAVVNNLTKKRRRNRGKVTHANQH